MTVASSTTLLWCVGWCGNRTRALLLPQRCQISLRGQHNGARRGRRAPLSVRESQMHTKPDVGSHSEVSKAAILPTLGCKRESVNDRFACTWPTAMPFPTPATDKLKTRQNGRVKDRGAHMYGLVSRKRHERAKMSHAPCLPVIVSIIGPQETHDHRVRNP